MNQQLFELLEYTSRSVFLTGKAGTGKTTFLNDFVKKTEKKHIIVAPTGIAAINAGGSTIHSMFSLPLRPFLPTVERIDENLGNNIADLMKHFKYRKNKIKLLREVEIIIIDEVSMLRADVLDMMDFALRHIRRNQKKFGGVQMLFIGDLHQLPPVVRDENILSEFYSTPYFFSAKSLENLNMITIELTKVYRQKDENFLQILNAIRDGDIKSIDFNALNSRFQPDFEPKDLAYIYLTSHNRLADNINQKKLNELAAPSFIYKAKIEGDFKESQYPNDVELELKIGSQVMFIRNDATQEKKYFNGKLAEVTYLDQENIYVKIEGSLDEYKLKKEVWENKRYKLGKDKNIEEEVLGSFEQFPIRLAWAVTIHKSQGLTFDRVIIDAGQSFASGQVYVALSRCRTLEGIILKSKITPDVIFNDRRVSGFQDATNANDKIEEIVSTEKFDYSIKKVLNKLDFRWIKQEIEHWNIAAKESKKLNQNDIQQLYISLKNECQNLSPIFEKFEKILTQKTKKFILGNEKWEEIENKAKGAVNFFFEHINETLFKPLKNLYAKTKGGVGLKIYNEVAKNFLDEVEEYLNDLKSLQLLETPLFDQKNKTKISTKVTKIPTHIITWQLFEQGKSITEIAKERGIQNSTIYGHFSKFAEIGKLSEKDLKRILSTEKIQAFKKVFQAQQFDNLNEWKKALPEDFDYGEIRLLWNFFMEK